MVGRLGSTKFPSNEFVFHDHYFLGQDGQTAHIKCEIHLVDVLDANLLIGVMCKVPKALCLIHRTKQLLSVTVTTSQLMLK